MPLGKLLGGFQPVKVNALPRQTEPGEAQDFEMPFGGERERDEPRSPPCPLDLGFRTMPPQSGAGFQTLLAPPTAGVEFDHMRRAARVALGPSPHGDASSAYRLHRRRSYILAVNRPLTPARHVPAEPWEP